MHRQQNVQLNDFTWKMHQNGQLAIPAILPPQPETPLNTFASLMGAQIEPVNTQIEGKEISVHTT